MPNNEGKFAIGGLAFLAFWLFVILPFLYCPATGQPSAQPSSGDQDAITFYTLLLAIFNFLLVLVTGGLVVMGSRQEWWMRKHERAYVIAGPGTRMRKKVEGEDKPIIVIGITAGNYGRTPAFPKEITVGLCPFTTGPLPPYPPYQTCEDVLYPNYNRKDVDTIFKIDIQGSDEQICYGRITYNDIFGREHWSSWKHQILPDENRNSIALSGAYSTGWDYNREQKKSDPP
jgi:hypothetical protein